MNRLLFALTTLSLAACGTNAPCTAEARCSANVSAVDTDGAVIAAALEYSLDGGEREACEDLDGVYCCGWERAGEITVYEVGEAAALRSVNVAQDECHVVPESLTVTIPNSTPEPVITPGTQLEVVASHQECETADDCAAVVTGCGLCDGDCAGVRPEHVAAYEEALVCDAYDGPECDFDCRPEFGLTRLVCIENVCGLVAEFDG